MVGLILRGVFLIVVTLSFFTPLTSQPYTKDIYNTIIKKGIYYFESNQRKYQDGQNLRYKTKLLIQNDTLWIKEYLPSPTGEIIYNVYYYKIRNVNWDVGKIIVLVYPNLDQYPMEIQLKFMGKLNILVIDTFKIRLQTNFYANDRLIVNRTHYFLTPQLPVK